MAEFYLVDRVVETSTTTGTGAFTLAGAVLGFQAFSTAFLTGTQFHYLIEGIDVDGLPTGEWETGIGSYSGVNTLTRLEAHYSSDGFGPFVDFAAGTKRVQVAATSTTVNKIWCLATKTADSTAVNAAAGTVAVAFDDHEADEWSLHDDVTDNTRITVPSQGVRRMKFTGQVALSSVTAAKTITIHLVKNGSLAYEGYTSNSVTSNHTDPRVNFSSPIMKVDPGDYFEMHLGVETDTSVTIEKEGTWFCGEAVV